MIKYLVFTGLTAVSLHSFFRLMLGKQKVVIVMYHGVLRDKLPLPCWWQLPFDEFAWQIRYLKKHYHIMPLREVVERIKNGQPLAPNTAVITFDDGFENNCTTAYPLLKELNVPATIFLVTDLIGTGKYLWHDELFIMFMGTRQTALDLRSVGLGQYSLKDLRDKSRSLWDVGEHLKTVKADLKNAIMKEIKSQLTPEGAFGPHADNFKLMSWEQVERMKGEGLIDFGSHSCAHEILSQVSRERLDDEIRRSCERLRSMGPVMFAYPNGRRQDFPSEAKNILADNGALCALSTIPGVNDIDQDLFELKRVAVGNDTARSTFQLMTSGFVDFFKPVPKPAEKNTRNVVFLSDCFADTTAGAEKQIVELVRRLDKLKYKLFIVSLDYCGPSVAPLLTSMGCQLKVMRVKRIYGLSGLLQGIRFFRFLRREKIDIVQTYHFGSDIWGTVIARLAGVKVVFSNRRDMGFWRGKQHVQTYRLINRWVKKVIVNAASIKDLVVKEEGVAPEKIEVIYNGVETGPQQGMPLDPLEIRRSIGVGADDPVLMQVANLKPVKAHILVLQAMPGIIKEFPGTKLVLIGEDMLNGQLKNDAERLGIGESVIFLGKRKDVSRLLSVADVGILSSDSEGMSNAILEYMTAGKPVVATRVGGTPELIDDGISGLLVPKGDSPAIRQAVIQLLGDRELRRSMGSRGREKALARFSMQGMVGHYLKLYDQYRNLLSGFLVWMPAAFNCL